MRYQAPSKWQWGVSADGFLVDDFSQKIKTGMTKTLIGSVTVAGIGVFLYATIGDRGNQLPGRVEDVLRVLVLTAASFSLTFMALIMANVGRVTVRTADEKLLPALRYITWAFFASIVFIMLDVFSRLGQGFTWRMPFMFVAFTLSCIGIVRLWLYTNARVKQAADKGKDLAVHVNEIPQA